ncbi:MULTISPECIES: ABC transporter substrate-binding protein [unclassified Adlercreutzia]|uniref:ABC transporter substrate-binding protein n=1 Tax=unclassified Adlercreutzia TaxID=2636013 RepID=UPI0013EC042A|nr:MULTISPECIES: ABC transporter substrate-binding protein [unclassified Adlercreutzia]
MKIKKWGALVACGALVAALGLFGCSSNNAASSASSSAAADGDAGSLTLLKEGTLTVATSPDYPPFENLEDGEYVGFDIDLAKAVAEEMGLECEFVSLQFDGITPAIAAGGQADVGFSGISVDPKRAKEIDFTDSYYIDDQAVAAMKGGAITPDNAAAELNKEGVVIAVQSGTTGETYAQENFPNATVKGYGNSTDCFAAMQSGNATAVCTNLAVVNRMLESAYADAQVVIEVATGEEYAAVVAQDNPELTEAINAALKTLKDNGTLDELTNKWF